MLTKEENDLLCRVENDAPMGQLMRRHWVPVCMSEEVAEPDGAPVRLRILGGEYVAFRDSKGRLGVLDGHCPHRGALLALGRNEDCGLRCLYHGWKIDVEGTVQEMASEPPESALKTKVKHESFPVEESGGFVWAYLGPRESMPAFEPPPFAADKSAQVSILKIKIPCNWAQIQEGQIDSAHSSSLHYSDMKPARVGGAEADDKSWYRPSTDKSPKLQIERTAYGFHYAAIRRPIKNAATHNYIRVTEYLAPFVSLIPPNNIYNVASVNVPVDDTTTMFYFIAWGNPETCTPTDAWRQFCHAVPGKDLNPDWSPIRTLENNFLQDRDAMRGGDNFTGIPGIPNQDIAMWVGMGPIVDRSKDILGASDMAIVEFRRLMVDAAKAMAETGEAFGVGASLQGVQSYQEVMPKEVDWRTKVAQETQAAE
ncbi:MAG: Rieske 2Fe-2S domain-containing protein [Alphaproteobacteria bacterium]|nr:Rieske 2Fe-2S domain-containing protein [Alphaproteobacteria bacterium]